MDALFALRVTHLAKFAGLHDFEETSEYTSGTGTRYPSNILVRKQVRLFLRPGANVLAPGKRLPPAVLIRHIDGGEGQLWSFMQVKLDFKLILFVGEAIDAPIVHGLCNLLCSSDSPLTADKRTSGTKDKFVDLFVIHTYPHMEMVIANQRQPFPHYAHNFFEDSKGEWHANLGLSPKLGGICVIRPDGYVAIASNLDDCGSIRPYIDQLRQGTSSVSEAR